MQSLLAKPKSALRSGRRGYAVAERKTARAREYILRLNRAINHKGWDAVAYKRIRALVPSGIYESWESTRKLCKFWYVSKVVPDAEGNRPPIVLCLPLHPTTISGEMGRELVDSRMGFLEPIESLIGPVQPYIGPRFRLIKKLTKAKRKKLKRALRKLRQKQFQKRELFLQELKRLGI